MPDRNRCAMLATVMLIALFSGCSSSDDVFDPTGGNNALGALTTDRFAVPDGNDVLASVEDLTLESPMVVNATYDGSSFRRHPAFPPSEGTHVGYLLRDLGITEQQMMQIAELIRSYFDTVRDQLQGIRDVNQPLIDDANAQRDAIIAAFQNGEITEEEARQQLHDLNQATREAIRNNPANEPFFAAICDAKASLFDAIRNVLDPDQQAVWDAWVSTLSGPCLGSEA